MFFDELHKNSNTKDICTLSPTPLITRCTMSMTKTINMNSVITIRKYTPKLV